MNGPAAATRLYALLARGADRAVVFRRGPSGRVLLVAWDLARDTFTEGQWLRGRIYERRCDLSPSGERLVYFAAQWRRKEPTWTAVSHPPWLTAVALWKNPLGAWGGGGLFDAEHTLRINHIPPGLTPDRQLPRKVNVGPLGPGSGGGEDFPIWEERLIRDGWTLLSASPSGFPRAYTRPRPGDPELTLQMHLLGVAEQNQPWYLTEHALVVEGRQVSLPDAEWAEWDRKGDLLYASAGQLFRVRPRLGRRDLGLSEARQLADLRGATFANRAAPRGYGAW